MSETESYFTVTEALSVPFHVKDSRFIAHLSPAASQDSAEEFIRKVSARFADATHNCYAYRIGTGDSCLSRMNDAGEPAGTAGRPILQALEARKVSDAALLVTRYFGGTKLGIGGLIRAYSGAAFAVLDQARLIEVLPKVIRKIIFAYHDTGNVHQALHHFQAEVLNSEFGEKAVLEISVVRKKDQSLRQALIDATRGKILYK